MKSIFKIHPKSAHKLKIEEDSRGKILGIAGSRNPGNIYLEDNMRKDNLGQDSSTACLLAFALLLYKRMY